MTLYYTLVFVLLMAEMALFMLLIFPLPFTIKRRLFTFISESPIVAKIQYWMKITFVFILILFIDSVNRVYRVQVDLAAVSESNSKNGGVTVMGHERLEVQARKFYSQRNMYLCGFTLFLSLILNRTYVMILEQMRLEDRLKTFEGTNKNTRQSEKLAMAGDANEIGNLKRKLANKEKELERSQQDLETLKKQSNSLHKEYHSLGDQHTQDDATPKKDR